MKQTYIVNEGNAHLVLFFAGWGMDEQVFMDYRRQGSDLLICYDYRSLDFDASSLGRYDTIDVVAWSMGVWVASHVLSNQSLKIRYSIACNGTLYPVDDERGIAQAVFQGTHDGLSEASLWKFFRRMCGTNLSLESFRERAPKRSVQELKDELLAINELYRKNKGVLTLIWNKAIIGVDDRIFLTSNQQKAWAGRTVIEQVKAAHYSEELLRELIEKEYNG